MQILSDWASFGGRQTVYTHDSDTLGCAMELALCAPPQAAAGPVPVLTYLSGLTCTWENATTKAGLQAWAAEFGVIVVCPDTSPRGDDVPDPHGLGLGLALLRDARHLRAAVVGLGQRHAQRSRSVEGVLERAVRRAS